MDTHSSGRARRGSARTGAVAFLVLALAVAALAGCEQERDDASLADGLLVLSGEIGSLTLTVREGTRATERELTLPDPATTWVSAGRTNVLLATLVDGRTFVSGPLDDEDPTWRLVEAVTVADVAPEPPLYFGSWDPPGGAFVQLGADLTEAAGLRVVVTDPSLEGATEVALTQSRPVAAPPVWVDPDRVAVVTATPDATEVVVVDTVSGATTRGPAGVRLVATSGDAGTAAVWPGAGGRVEVLATDRWLDGASGSIGIQAPDGSNAPAVLALDASGRRLAVVWVDDAGEPTSVAVYAAERDWGRVASIDLGEATAAAAAWLR